MEHTDAVTAPTLASSWSSHRTPRCVREHARVIADWGLVSSAFSASKRHGVVVDFCYDVTADFIGTADGDEQLVRLREFMDVAHMMSVAAPANLASSLAMGAQSTTCLDNRTDNSIMYDEIGEIIDAVKRGVPSDVRFQLAFCGVHPRILKEKLAGYFIKHLGSSLSTDALFLRFRQRLLSQLHTSKNKSSLHRPVSLTLEISSPEDGLTSLLEVDEFFSGLQAVLEETHRLQTTKEVLWDVQRTHAPIVVEKVMLSLNRMPITPSVVAAAAKLLSTGIRVDVERINLDPRMISCSPQELTTFVRSLSEGSTSCSIITGLDPGILDISSLPADCDDRTDLIRSIALAIAAAPNVCSVNLEGLMALATSERNRRALYSDLLPSVLARSPRLGECFFECPLPIPQREVDWIHEGFKAWRAAHPGVQFQAVSISICVTSSEPAFIHELISNLDDAEEVIVRKSMVTTSVSSATVRSILRFPSLLFLLLDSCEIDTMDVFDASVADDDLPQKRSLMDISLGAVVLKDQPSLLRFVQRLGDPSHPLASNLAVLCIGSIFDAQDAEDEDEFLLPWIETLGDVLSTNQTLLKVLVTIPHVVDDMGSTDVEWQTEQVHMLKKHDKKLVPTSRAMRRTGFHQTRKLAFLSVVHSDTSVVPTACRQLDAAVLSVIFGYIVPLEMREISSNY